MNVYDADRLRTVLKSRGYQEIEEQDADVIIFVTCSIRQKAEQKVLSDVGRLRTSWQEQKKPKVVLIGCMAQRIGERLIQQFPWVRLVAGPRHLGVVPDLIEKINTEEKQFCYLDDDPRALEDLCSAPIERTNPYKAYISIAHGCDFFCSYCIVPYVRGRFQSKQPQQILNEAKSLVESGVVELTLLGQNVNSYGKDLDHYSFSLLLEQVVSLPGLKRLRFTTSHPVDFSEDILEMMRRYPQIMPVVNLPIQSGSDVILKEMNRGYSVADYKKVIDKIREMIPNACITTDLIVGFPGETEEDFKDSIRLLEHVRFDMVHTAAYSPREGTVAAKRADMLTDEEKQDRLRVMNQMQAAIGDEINQQLIGMTLPVLFDGIAPKREGYLMGRTEGDKIVFAKADAALMGQIVPVQVKSATAWSLEADVCDID